MKNYIKRFSVIAMLLCFAMTFPASQTQAQTSLISPGNGSGLDTVTNTGVKTLWVKITGYRETVTATINVTKISGTLGGTMIPIASNDGVNFYDVSQRSADTVTVANVTAQGKNYSYPRGYQYYGVQWTGTGTMSGSFNGKLIARKTSD